MRLASVLNYLKEDAKVTTLINHKRSYPKITAYKAHDKNAYPYVTVKLEPFLEGMVVSQYRCEVRVVIDDEIALEPITTAIIDRLHFGNKPAVEQDNNLIYDSIHSGGTLVHDEEKGVFEQLLIFNIKFDRK